MSAPTPEMSAPSAPPGGLTGARATSGRRPRASPSALAVRRFRTHKLAVAGLVVILLIALAALAAPLLATHSPTAVNLAEFRSSPSAAHLLGTDSAGRDVLSRLLHAGRVSLGVGLTAAVTAAAIGLVLGAIAGNFGGWVDSVIMRATDVVLAFPSLVIVLVFVAVAGPSMGAIVLAIGLFEWPVAARIVRGMTLSLREQDFIQAARALGAPHRWVIVRHIVPSVVSPLIVVTTLLVAQAVLMEAALSFLGLGIQPPNPSWGNMLYDAQSLTILQTMPWLWIPPGVAIAVSVLSVNFVGDGLRDALDPRR